MNVKTLCLGVLSERDLSGYEIKKSFEESFRHFFLAGFGSFPTGQPTQIEVQPQVTAPIVVLDLTVTLPDFPGGLAQLLNVH